MSVRGYGALFSAAAFWGVHAVVRGGAFPHGARVIRATDVPMSYRGSTHRYVVIRRYTGEGLSAHFDALAERKDDVKAIISIVRGFASYAAVRTDGGGQTVIACQDNEVG